MCWLQRRQSQRISLWACDVQEPRDVFHFNFPPRQQPPWPQRHHPGTLKDVIAPLSDTVHDKKNSKGSQRGYGVWNL